MAHKSFASFPFHGSSYDEDAGTRANLQSARPCQLSMMSNTALDSGMAFGRSEPWISHSFQLSLDLRLIDLATISS